MTNNKELQEVLILKENLKLENDMLKTRGKKFAKLFKKFAKIWSKYFKKQVQHYIDYIENNPQMAITVQKMTTEEFFANFDIDIEELLRQLHEQGMFDQDEEIRSSSFIGVEFGINNEYSKDFAKYRAPKLISGVNDTTEKEILKTISDMMQNQSSMKEIKTAIYDKFTQFSEYRAGLISVMETANAYEIGKKKQLEQYTSYYGSPGFKRSYVADITARPTHIQNAEAGWIRADDLFPGTSTEHAPHGFNCRCHVTYSVFNPDTANFLES